MSDHHARERTILAPIRQAVLERDNFQCQVCGTTGDNRLHLHHWQHFRSQGGGDTVENLVTVCKWDHDRIHRYEIDIEVKEVAPGEWASFVRRGPPPGPPTYD